MTPMERAEDVHIVEEDHGDHTVSNWRVNQEKTRANIADAIQAAVLEEREACAKVAEKDDEESCLEIPSARIASAIRARSYSIPSHKNA